MTSTIGQARRLLRPFASVPESRASVARRYAIAVVSIAAAVLIARLLSPIVPPHNLPPYLLAVVVAAACGGTGPGLLAAVLATIAVGRFEIGTTSPQAADVVRLVAFAASTLVISSLTAAKKEAEVRLTAALAEVSAIDQAKDELMAAVSHELRTPLTGILGWLEILDDDHLDEETRRTALDTIRICARTQATLVEDLLDLSRIVLGKLHIERQPFLFRDAVEEVVQAVLPNANGREIRIRYEPASAPLVVEGDRKRLRQVVWNLLTNAVKFGAAGGQVVIAERLDGRQLVLTVSDDGEGISPGLLPHIFEPLRQESTSIRKGGLGLGLAIAQYLVECHEGTIAAQSDGPGRGATFTVRLPVKERRR